MAMMAYPHELTCSVCEYSGTWSYLTAHIATAHPGHLPLPPNDDTVSQARITELIRIRLVPPPHIQSLIRTQEAGLAAVQAVLVPALRDVPAVMEFIREYMAMPAEATPQFGVHDGEQGLGSLPHSKKRRQDPGDGVQTVRPAQPPPLPIRILVYIYPGPHDYEYTLTAADRVSSAAVRSSIRALCPEFHIGLWNMAVNDRWSVTISTGGRSETGEEEDSDKSFTLGRGEGEWRAIVGELEHAAGTGRRWYATMEIGIMEYC